MAKLEQSYDAASVTPSYVAFVYFVLGELDEAFIWLQRL